MSINPGGDMLKRLALLAPLLLLAQPVYATPYQFDLTTSYAFGACPSAGVTGGSCGSPDTGLLEILNSGLSTFVGTISLTGVAGLTAPGGNVNESWTGT